MSQQNDSDYESEYEQPAQVYSNQCSWKFEDGKWVRTVEEKSEANLLQVCSDQSKECGWKFEDEKCVRRDAENSEFKKIDGAGACKGVGVLLFGTANKMLLAKGIGKSAQRAVSAKAVHCKKHVKDVFGIKILGARAEAKLGNAAAGASVTPIQGETFAKVSGVEASAHAYLIEGITEVNAKVVVAEVQTNAGAGIKSLGAEAEASATAAKAEANAALLKEVVEAKASATAAKAQANARVGLKDLGAYAGASATAGKVEAAVTNVPFAQASATGAEAIAEAGASWKLFGATAGAHVGEVKAGPLALRAGVKVGVAVRSGVPEVDVGPVTCSIM